MASDDLAAKVTQLKSAGAQAFAAKQYSQAEACYSEALGIADSAEVLTVLHSNRSCFDVGTPPPHTRMPQNRMQR